MTDKSKAENDLDHAKSLATQILECDRVMSLPDDGTYMGAMRSTIGFCEAQERRKGLVARLLSALTVKQENGGT